MGVSRLLQRDVWFLSALSLELRRTNVAVKILLLLELNVTDWACGSSVKTCSCLFKLYFSCSILYLMHISKKKKVFFLLFFLDWDFSQTSNTPLIDKGLSVYLPFLPRTQYSFLTIAIAGWLIPYPETERTCVAAALQHSSLPESLQNPQLCIEWRQIVNRELFVAGLVLEVMRSRCVSPGT